jgi:glutamate/tyrosine decarboxylase-like PLP-dependent enzyme
MNRRIENSSRFRALPAWMTLKAYGRQGYRELVERLGGHARALATWIETRPELALVAPPRFNLVLFRGRNADTSLIERAEDHQRLLRHINETGEVSLTAGVHDGKPAIRVAFAKWQTTTSDVERAGAAILEGIAAYQRDS